MPDPINSLEMSDEEFLKNSAQILRDIPEQQESPNDPPANNEDEDPTEDDEEESPNQDAEGQQGEADAEPKSDEGEEDEEDKNKSEEDESDKETKTKPRDESGKFVKQPENKENKPTDKPKEEVKPANGEIDYKAQHDLLLSPVKANGRDFQVKSVEEARHLISMGLNYNKKMAGLKPHLALVKQLQNAELLDPDKINYLIDLSNGNPQAIAKLVAEHKIDPLNINSDDAQSYKPTNRTVTEHEVELDNVIDDLKDHPKFTEVMQLVSKEWDRGSQQEIAKDPTIMRKLAAQMESGIYDRITLELERRKVFGNTSGKSDLEAYREIGSELAQSGAFDDIIKPNGNGTQQKPTAKAGEIVDPSKAQDEAREQQRKAAAPSKVAKPASKKTIPDDFNPLNMSDDDFKKLNFKL